MGDCPFSTLEQVVFFICTVFLMMLCPYLFQAPPSHPTTPRLSPQMPLRPQHPAIPPPSPNEPSCSLSLLGSPFSSDYSKTLPSDASQTTTPSHSSSFSSLRSLTKSGVSSRLSSLKKGSSYISSYLSPNAATSKKTQEALTQGLSRQGQNWDYCKYKDSSFKDSLESSFLNYFKTITKCSWLNFLLFFITKTSTTINCCL